MNRSGLPRPPRSLFVFPCDPVCPSAITTRSVERGPLVYSLRIGEEWTRVNADKPHRELPHGDFEVRSTTAWNHGLIVDDARPENGLQFEERPLGERPFSAEGAGMIAHARGR